MVAWHNQHVVGHHVYTNIMGADPDLPVCDKGDLRRIVKRQAWQHFYRYQHIYMPLLYGFLTVKVCFVLSEFIFFLFIGFLSFSSSALSRSQI